MIRFANPAQFLRLKGLVLPWVAALCILCAAAGLWLALAVSPPDYQQGDAVRIMYVHVPASWMALGVYTFMAASSAIGFVWKHPLADLSVKAAAPIGLCFTFVSLITGSIWGKPMWGTWWVWDARLTSVLILLFLYAGYMALVDAHEDPHKGLKAGSILTLVGVVNIPIIKWSVNWWNTLHQPASLTKIGAPSIHPEMLWPLLLMAAAYGFFFISLLLMRLEHELLQRKIRALSIMHVELHARRESAAYFKSVG